jgi:hypothetical protein
MRACWPRSAASRRGGGRPGQGRIESDAGRQEIEPPVKCQAIRSHSTLSGARRYAYTHHPRQTGRSGAVRTPQRAAAPALGVQRPRQTSSFQVGRKASQSAKCARRFAAMAPSQRTDVAPLRSGVRWRQPLLCKGRSSFPLSDSAGRAIGRGRQGRALARNSRLYSPGDPIKPSDGGRRPRLPPKPSRTPLSDA